MWSSLHTGTVALFITVFLWWHLAHLVLAFVQLWTKIFFLCIRFGKGIPTKLFQTSGFLAVSTRELVSLFLQEEYPSAHPSAHFNLLQGINNQLNLMCYNLFTKQNGREVAAEGKVS